MLNAHQFLFEFGHARRLPESERELGLCVLRAVACRDVEVVDAVLGKGAVSAINVGKPGANIARLRFGEKREVVLMVADKETLRAGYQINVYGEKGWRSVTPGLKNLYAYLLEAFLDLVITGKESAPIEEEVEVIAALEAANRSLELGR